MLRTLCSVLLLGLFLLPGACAAPSEEAETAGEPQTVTIYSGRNESLVKPLLDRFAEDNEIEIQVRYGSTAEMAATLMEEGEATPADLFISQDAAALGALSSAQQLLPLPKTVLDRVPAAYASPKGDWVGLSGRARTVVYNTELVQPEDLPQSLEAVTDPRYKGRFGIAPTNASFQAHMAAYRAARGPDALEELLGGMNANEPRFYPKNSPIVEAVLAGEIEWGLVNHYYLWRALAERPDAPGANFFMPEGPVSSFVNLAGVGMLHNTEASRAVLEFLVSDEAQEYFAQETFEYPLVPGVAAAVDLPPLSELKNTRVDFADAGAVLEETLEAIRASGLLP
ncbi:MAG: extracellular solute-binding protein [Acidobacteriota bacterium]|nr:extracellular solute-binding protein [Acidobacteriota bacterium]